MIPIPRMNAVKKVQKTTVGVELLRLLAEDGKRIITLDDARQYAAGAAVSEQYLAKAFHYLERDGWIKRLHKGLYQLLPPLINAPIHEYEVAMHLVSNGAISHWSAMSFHGFTEQIPRTIFVLTTDSITRMRGTHGKPYQIGGWSYEFIQVKPERFFGVEAVWFGESRIAMTDRERTLLDGLMRPNYCGGFADVAETFIERIADIDVKKIVDYALRLDAATARRLGWILSKAGVEPERLEPLRKAITGPGYRSLDPAGPKKGPWNKEWKVQENVAGLV